MSTDVGWGRCWVMGDTVLSALRPSSRRAVSELLPPASPSLSSGWAGVLIRSRRVIAH